MAFVPPSQIVENPSLRHRVKRSQRLIQQQGARSRHQRARQGNPLPLASGNLRRPPIEESGNAERLGDLARAAIALSTGSSEDNPYSMFCRTVMCGNNASV